MPLSQFDGVVYINLERRSERKRSLLSELARLNVDEKKVHRIEAVDDPFNGIRGCLQSHIQALDFVEKKGWKRGLILEDDAIFTEDPNRIKEEVTLFFDSAKEEWDIYLLGGMYWKAAYTSWEKIYLIKRSLRSHAYSVHPNYLDTLRRCFQGAVEAIRSHVFFHQSDLYAVDFIWEELQWKDRWFGPKDPLCHQGEFFSDITHFEKKFRAD